MATYSEIKAGLDQIANRNERNRSTIESVKAQIDKAVADLAAMVTDFGTLVTEIDAAATGNPTEEAFQVAQSEKNQLVADFQALKTRAENIQTAISGM